jgi:hypothetical protein
MAKRRVIKIMMPLMQLSTRALSLTGCATSAQGRQETRRTGRVENRQEECHGWSDDNVNSTFLQPFVSFTTKKQTTLTLNTESTYDWTHHQWTVPLNLMLSRLVKIDKQPVQFQIGGRYYAEKPDGGPDWGLRFTVTFLFPK